MNPKLNVMVCGSLLALVLLPATQVLAQSAEDASAACMEAARLIDEQDYVGALDEAQWCVEGLRQLKQARILTVFPDAVNGFSGGDINNQSAMGMTFIERQYTQGDQVVSVSLTSGVAGGGLAAFAQLASGIGIAGGNKLRVQKRTVIDMGGANARSEYMVQLKSGGVLMISSDELDSETLLAFIKKFPVANLDESLMP